MTGHIYKKKRPATGSAEEERVIMHDGDVSSSVTSESEHGSDPPGFPRVNSCRRALDSVLHSTKFQMVIVCLVVFNSLVVVVELVIDLRVFELHSGGERAVARALHHANIAILSLFVLEMAARIIALGARFFKHRMEMFDCVVVALAFSLGIAFEHASNNGVGLLILLRLWRLTKILNSMVAAVRAEAERRVARERRARRALEREVAKLREYCLQQECELQMYRLMLQRNGIAQPTMLRPPPAPRTLSVIAEVNELSQLDDPDGVSPPP